VGEIDADGGQGLTLGEAEDPVAHVGLGMPFAKMRVEIHREDVPVGFGQAALESHFPPSGGEVDHGFQGSYASHAKEA
jgi:hypothetical protein